MSGIRGGSRPREADWPRSDRRAFSFRGRERKLWRAALAASFLLCTRSGSVAVDLHAAPEISEGAGDEKRGNLVVNGSFEKGARGRPTGWQLPDGLTSFWVEAPGRSGRCIRIDTDVLASQFREREDEIAGALEKGAPPPPPPKRRPTRPPKYDTVAGLDGVHFSTDSIPLDPGKYYKLQVDVRVEGKASPKVWVKAYARVKSRGGLRNRIVWKKSLNCEGADREWATYTMVFPRNTSIPGRVDHVRVQLYPYWPPATYFFDNVRLVEIRPAEAEAYDLERDLRAPVKPGRKKRTGRVERSGSAMGSSVEVTGAAPSFLLHALTSDGRKEQNQEKKKERKKQQKKDGEKDDEKDRPWVGRKYRARRQVTLPRGARQGDAILLRFGTAALTRASGRDVRLVADQRVVVPLKILEEGPGDTVLICFQVYDPSLSLDLYFGNPFAAAPKRPSRSFREGLLFELWELPQGPCESWTEAARLLKAADRPLGVLTPTSVFRGLPPLGRRREYLGRYTGYLQVRTSGPHTFETVSDGASFLRIDGKLVASWPGYHGIGGYRNAEERTRHSGEVHLKEGLHSLEYVVATPRGGVHLVGWAEPGEERLRPISARHYLPWKWARAGVLESPSGAATADFEWRSLSDTNSDVERHDLAELEFRFHGDLRGREIEKIAWDFGDGQEGEGVEVHHVYLGHGLYQVGMTVTFVDGETLTATGTAAARFESLERLNLDALLTKYYEETRNYDLETLSAPHLRQLAWLRRKDDRWKQDLWAVVDAWYERALSPTESAIAQLGLRRASQLIREGERDTTVQKILSSVAAEAPEDGQRAEARMWLAWSALRRDGRDAYEAATRTLKELYEGGATAEVARRSGLLLAKAHLRQAKSAAARPIFTRLETDPGDRRYSGPRHLAASARRLSFDNLLRREKYSEALDELERWEWELPMDYLTGGLQLAWARYYRARKRPEDALAELESVKGVATARQELPRILLLEANILRAQHKLKEARARLKRLVKEFPERPESREAARALRKLGSRR